MGPKNIVDALNLEAVGVEPDKTMEPTYLTRIVPARKRSKVVQKQDVSNAANNAKSATRTGHFPGHTGNTVEIAIRNQANTPKDQLDTERGINTTGSPSYKLSQCKRKNALDIDDSKNTDRGDAFSDDLARLHKSTRDVGALVLSLQSQLHDAKIAVRASKRKRAIQIARLKRELVSARGERDTMTQELAEQNAQVKLQCDNNHDLEKKISVVESQKRFLEQNLITMDEHADKMRKSEGACLKELEQARVALVTVKGDLQQKNAKQENELISMREEKNRLQASLETIQKDLEDEKEKTLCQICLESTKDAVCFPCLHLHYCFPCLEKHRLKNDSCPTCRATINGVLRWDISV
ncbi:unnamed protein product [Calypogeia fissa]